MGGPGDRGRRTRPNNPVAAPNWASFTYVPNHGFGGFGSVQGCASFTDGQYGFDCPVPPLGQ